VEKNWYNYDATATAKEVTPSDRDWDPTWAANNSSSAWIAYNPDDAYDNGLGDYSTTFVLTSADVSTVSISGAWAVDDSGSLYLNGHLIESLGDFSWGSLTDFSVAVGSSDFVVGTNTLSIDITGTDSYLEGVRLEGTLYGDPAPTPEPDSMVLLGTGLLSLALFARRRRHVQRKYSTSIA
jgi:hypothetical protein